MLGTPEPERLKVTALNLWEDAHLAAASRLSAHPTTSTSLSRSRFLHITTQFLGEEGKPACR
jgi:hypothetical protein